MIKGRNYSINMPPTMAESREGVFFDFPGPSRADGHVHYVTIPVRSLQDARRITLRYRIDAAPGTRFVPQEFPDRTATLSLFIQRSGDGWTRRYPTHRWYSPADRVMPLRPGIHTVSIDFEESWIPVLGGQTDQSRVEAFRAARENASRVGFTFGSDGGRGHGVFATRPARFTILDFEIE